MSTVYEAGMSTLYNWHVDALQLASTLYNLGGGCVAIEEEGYPV